MPLKLQGRQTQKTFLIKVCPWYFTLSLDFELNVIWRALALPNDHAGWQFMISWKVGGYVVKRKGFVISYQLQCSSSSKAKLATFW